MISIIYSRRSFYSLILVCYSVLLSAQFVILSTQAEVDAFDNSVTVVEGSLVINKSITGDYIYDLSNLSNIKTVKGGVTIEKYIL